MRDDLRRMAVFTSGIAEMTRNRAEDFVRGWIRSGDERREHAQTMVKDLMDWSRENRKELTAFVKTEIQTQVTALGVATSRDLERLERRIERLEESARAGAARSAPKSPRRKTTAAKSRSSKSSSRKKPTARTRRGDRAES